MRYYIDLVEAAIGGRKRRSTMPEFLKMAQDQLGAKAARMNIAELTQLATDNGVQLPSGIRVNPDLKVDAHHWNLTGRSADDAEVDKAVAHDIGVEVEPSVPGDDTTIRLANVQKVRNLVATGKIYIFGRKLKGAFYRITGAEEMLATLERAYSRELASQGTLTMEAQFEDLRERVELVASGRSARKKALLLTGAPRSGKTFTVMQTLDRLGFKEDTDFVVRKGKSTPVALYKTLIEQINGLTIYDDCDDVIDTDTGINMLKNALDSSPIRDVNYDVPRTTVNVAVLPRELRNKYTDIVAKLLKAEPISTDEFEVAKNVLQRLRLWGAATKGVKKGAAAAAAYDLDDEEGEGEEEGGDEDVDSNEMDALSTFAINRLPNKIDYSGRMIFISNLSEEEWPDAIVQRAFVQNMNFRDDEMIDFINRIKSQIPMAISDEEKQEVWDFVTDLWKTGKLKSRVSFGLAFDVFDLRLTPNWRRMVSQL